MVTLANCQGCVIVNITKQACKATMAKAGQSIRYPYRYQKRPGGGGYCKDKKFAYDIWRDTVNTAARMEQHGEPGKINISQSTYELIKGNFGTEHRGQGAAKNKGKVKMYFVMHLRTTTRIV